MEVTSPFSFVFVSVTVVYPLSSVFSVRIFVSFRLLPGPPNTSVFWIVSPFSPVVVVVFSVLVTSPFLFLVVLVLVSPFNHSVFSSLRMPSSSSSFSEGGNGSSLSIFSKSTVSGKSGGSAGVGAVKTLPKASIRIVSGSGVREYSYISTGLPSGSVPFRYGVT